MPLTLASEEPNAREAVEAIAVGDALLASERKERCAGGYDLLYEAMS